MPSVLVIGASRGIGLELVRQYAAARWKVHGTTRSPDDPGELGLIAGDLSIHELEVRDPAHRASLAAELRGHPIDVLIHNAGVYRGYSAGDTMMINATAAIATVEALVDVVASSERKTIVLITSQMGSRRGSKRSLGSYGDSKAALNDAFRSLVPTWARRGIIGIVMHPGWVRTDMGGRSAPVSVEDSAAGVRRVIENLDRADHGRFFDYTGREVPW